VKLRAFKFKRPEMRGALYEKRERFPNILANGYEFQAITSRRSSAGVPLAKGVHVSLMEMSVYQVKRVTAEV